MSGQKRQRTEADSVGDGGEAAAGSTPGKPFDPRRTFQVHTVAGWDEVTTVDGIRAPLSHFVVGFHPASSALEAEFGKNLVSMCGQIMCASCAEVFSANGGDFKRHIDSNACQRARQSGQSSARVANQIAVRRASASLVGPQLSPEFLEEVATFTTALLTAHGLAPATIEKLFGSAHSIILRALIAVAPIGLGSRRTMGRRLDAVKTYIRKELVVLLREAAEAGHCSLFFDETSTRAFGGMAVALVFGQSPWQEQPFYIGAVVYSRAMKGADVKTLLRKACFALSDDEFVRIVTSVVADHASYVMSGVEDMGVVYLGDPAHMDELIIQAIIKPFLLVRQLILYLRKVLKVHVIACCWWCMCAWGWNATGAGAA